MEVVYVHHHPALIPLVASLLNKQWPRSEQTRIASLEKSSEGLPLHLALVSDQDAQEVTGETQLRAQERQFTTLLGCSSLAKVVDPNLSNSVLIENATNSYAFAVLVDPEKRAKGYGRLLMEKTETAAIKLGFSTAYLSTTDKELFYAHLGYEICSPVTTGSGAETLLSADRMNGIMHLFGSVAKNKGPKVVWMKKNLVML